VHLDWEDSSIGTIKLLAESDVLIIIQILALMILSLAYAIVLGASLASAAEPKLVMRKIVIGVRK